MITCVLLSDAMLIVATASTIRGSVTIADILITLACGLPIAAVMVIQAIVDRRAAIKRRTGK